MMYGLIANISCLIVCVIAVYAKDYYLRLLVTIFLPLLVTMNFLMLVGGMK